MLNAAFRYALSENIISKNPMLNIKRPKSQRATKKVYSLTVQEQQKLVEVLQGVEKENKYSAVFLLMLLTDFAPVRFLPLIKIRT